MGQLTRNEVFTLAVQKYSDAVYRAAMHNSRCAADAEDVVQDVYEKLLHYNGTVCYCIFTGEAARANCICGRFRFELFRNPFVFCGFMVYYRIRMRTNGLCAQFFIKFSSNAIFGGVQPCIG